MKTLILLTSLLTLVGCRHDNDGNSDAIITYANSASNTIVTPEPASFWLLLASLILIIGYFYIKPIMNAKFCDTCHRNGWGLYLENECRCHPEK